MENCYKIKLRRDGYRLVYQVIENKICILIWAVDKREDNKVYEKAQKRLEAIIKQEAEELNLP